MILPSARDAIHRMYLLRLLAAIVDDPAVSVSLAFKGGTAAVLAGWLDRFSLDLDFDLLKLNQRVHVASRLRDIAVSCGLNMKQSDKTGMFMMLGYEVPKGERNTLKLSIMTTDMAANDYAPLYLSDINRYVLCQTRDTMVANKLVASIDRWEKHQTIAGRDIYDIHYFLSHGYAFREEVIRARRGISGPEYIRELTTFIKSRVTDRMIAEDLNYLLPPARFEVVRRVLKEEVMRLLAGLVA